MTGCDCGCDDGCDDDDAAPDTGWVAMAQLYPLDWTEYWHNWISIVEIQSIFPARISWNSVSLWVGAFEIVSDGN